MSLLLLFFFLLWGFILLVCLFRRRIFVALSAALLRFLLILILLGLLSTCSRILGVLALPAASLLRFIPLRRLLVFIFLVVVARCSLVGCLSGTGAPLAGIRRINIPRVDVIFVAEFVSKISRTLIGRQSFFEVSSQDATLRVKGAYTSYRGLAITDGVFKVNYGVWTWRSWPLVMRCLLKLKVLLECFNQVFLLLADALGSLEGI